MHGGDAPVERDESAVPGEQVAVAEGARPWSWVAHRLAGVLTFFFLLLHVLDTSLLRVSPEAYDTVVGWYKNPVAAVLEVVLVGAVLFHALNGLRTVAIDLWSQGPRLQRDLLTAVVAIWILIMAPVAYFLLRYSAASLFGSS